MKTIESMLKKEKQELEKMIKRAKERMRTAPQGNIRVRKWRNVVEYYYVEQNKKPTDNGRYMKKNEIGLVRKIVQRDYDERMMRCAGKRLKEIGRFLKNYQSTSLKLLYQHMNPCRRMLLSDAVISDEEYAKRWQELEYTGKAFADDAPEIITERGERVRSKSEKIIADKLYMLGIPYRYEYPLVLEGNITIYPDFTILRMPQREEVYLEHFGMMDDEGYVDNVLMKLNTYERNGIYPGVHLFITHESRNAPLNIKALDALIKSLFCIGS